MSARADTRQRTRGSVSVTGARHSHQNEMSITRKWGRVVWQGRGRADSRGSEIGRELYRENRWGRPHTSLHFLVVSLSPLCFICVCVCFQYKFLLRIGLHLNFLKFSLGKGGRYIKHTHILINKRRLWICRTSSLVWNSSGTGPLRDHISKSVRDFGGIKWICMPFLPASSIHAAWQWNILRPWEPCPTKVLNNSKWHKAMLSNVDSFPVYFCTGSF